MADATESQHPLLVTTEWLAQQGDGGGIVLIDCGELVAYRRAHIPGAVSISHHPYLKGAGNSKLVMEADEFETLVRSLGVSNDSSVVLYDDNSSLHAARVWWVFERFGHTDVRVVDGGFNAWLAEGRPITSAPPRPEEGTFTATIDDTHLCTIDTLRQAVDGGSGLQIWDTRSDGEWDGSNDRGNKRTGRVPGAIHLEWLNLFEGPPSRRLRPLDDIRQTLVEAGLNPEAETVSY
ncbi:MAG: rhodanese-like domain-containing protein [Dehalococcoidia bacterium]|jgi:thiosulfate/3-mercaptopyruvate sulfurtransferase|nr:rhodanese-like domain-containing protein [Dehalococcoidia bacterium]